MHQSLLCSPSRLGWVKKANGKSRGCVFCKIAKSKRDAANMVVHRSGRFLVVMNIYPYNTGHIQVLPLKHVINLEDLSDEDVSEMSVLVKKCVRLLKKTLCPEGFNIGLNQGGEAAGASIGHLHVHIVPRFRRDFGFIDIIGGTKVLPEPVGKTYEKLKSNAKMLE